MGAGDFQTVMVIAKLDFANDVCGAMPYMALRPFRFTYTINGMSYLSPAYCPWSTNLTIFRVLLAMVNAVFYCLLIVNRFAAYSIAFAPPVHFVITFMWWAALVLDTRALAASSAASASGFGEESIFSILQTLEYRFNWDNTLYGATNAIDFFMFLVTFIIFRAWNQCRNKYGITQIEEPAPAARPLEPAAARTNNRLSTPPIWWRASENTRLSELYPRNSLMNSGSVAPTNAERAAIEEAEYKRTGTLTWFMRWWLSIGKYLERLLAAGESTEGTAEEAAMAGPQSFTSGLGSGGLGNAQFTTAAIVPGMNSNRNSNRLAVAGATVAANPLQLAGGYSSSRNEGGLVRPVFTPPLKPPKPALITRLEARPAVDVVAEAGAVRHGEEPKAVPVAVPNPFGDDEEDELNEFELQSRPPEPASGPPPLPFLSELGDEHHLHHAD